MTDQRQKQKAIEGKGTQTLNYIHNNHLHNTDDEQAMVEELRYAQMNM